LLQLLSINHAFSLRLSPPALTISALGNLVTQQSFSVRAIDGPISVVDLSTADLPMMTFTTADRGAREEPLQNTTEPGEFLSGNVHQTACDGFILRDSRFEEAAF
jgi:hypothetical protein